MGLDRFAAVARTRPRPRPAEDGDTPEVDGVAPATDDAPAHHGDLPASVARALDPATSVAEDSCELCTRPIGDRHRHVVDLAARSLQCACRPCGLLFDGDVAAGDHYRTVPEDHRRVEQFVLEPSQWTLLRIPVDLAFVMEDTVAGGTVAFYPSPAGATESELSLAAWQGIVAANPILADLRPDVEAVLIRVRDHHEPEAWLVPIDRCYELVGHLRLKWRGFGGGQEVREAIDTFFDEVGARAGSRVATSGTAAR